MKPTCQLNQTQKPFTETSQESSRQKIRYLSKKWAWRRKKQESELADALEENVTQIYSTDDENDRDNKLILNNQMMRTKVSSVYLKHIKLYTW